MLWADWAAFCCVSPPPLTEGGGTHSAMLPALFSFLSLSLNLTYNCHCLECRPITRTCLQGAIDVVLAVKAQKPPTRSLIAKHPLCRVNLSLTTNLSLIIGSWHLWRDVEIDSRGFGSWWGGIWSGDVELIYNDSHTKQNRRGNPLYFYLKATPSPTRGFPHLSR